MDIDRGQDDEGRRWYETADGVTAMSVTTVLGVALEEDTSGLDYWKRQHQGNGDEFHHEHIYWYSGPRGTLCHYQALKKFEDQHDDEQLWGEEERESMQAVVHGPSEEEFDDASADEEDIVYSVLKNQEMVQSRDQFEHLFADTPLVNVLHDDLDYFVDAFNTICDELGVTDESVIKIEKFMLNKDERYGGQMDMVYEDPNGETVVVDLKTSSSLRQKHRLQGVAYAHAVENADWGPQSVDRIEVWRIDPDDRSWQVHSHTIPPHVEHLYDEERPEACSYTDEWWFEDKWGDFEYESLDDMWTTFTELTEIAHDRVDTEDD